MSRNTILLTGSRGQVGWELALSAVARVGRKSGFIAPSAVCWHSADNAGKKPPAHPPYAGCWIAASAGASSQ